MLTSASLDWKWVSSMAVPKLRFKDSGGREFPEWEEVNFFSVIRKIIDFRGRTPIKLGAKWADKKTRHLALSALNVKMGYIDKAVDAHYGDSALYELWMKDNELYKGQVLFTMEAPAGNVAQVPDNEPYILSQRTIALEPKHEKVSDDFLACLLASEKVQKNIKMLATGGTAKGVSQKSLNFLMLDIPSLPEQQKIADFITAYDTMVDTQTKRVEAMKLRKKGLLQKIFSQEIRFKDDEGKDFPEWEEKKLGEVILRKSTTAFSNISLPGVEYEDIISGTGRLNKDVALKGISKKGILFDVGDVLYGKLRPYLKNWLLPDFSGIAIGDFWVLNSKHMVAGYIYYLIQSPEFSKVANTSIGTKMPRADWSLVSAYLVGVPSLPEQQKIADFLTAVDKQLEVEEKRLETMKTIKKGLLQQMFV